MFSFKEMLTLGFSKESPVQASVCSCYGTPLQSLHLCKHLFNRSNLQISGLVWTLPAFQDYNILVEILEHHLVLKLPAAEITMEITAPTSFHF